MSVFNNWVLWIVLYLGFATMFTQFYKISTKNLKKPGALTVLLEIIATLTILLLCPFFEMKFPEEPKVYIFLALSVIFYAINDRLNTTVRKGIEASTFSVIKQLSTTFMVFSGLIFLKEEFVLNKFIGAILIIFSNVLIFFRGEKGVKWNRYIALGILANISYTIALFLDVNISNNFNLPFYVALTLGVPAILIAIIEKIKFSDLKTEWQNGDKKSMLITGITWSFSILASLKAYQLQNVSIVAPLCALTVILNVIVGYLFFGEKENLLRKIIAAVLIIISVVLIKV